MASIIILKFFAPFPHMLARKRLKLLTVEYKLAFIITTYPWIFIMINDSQKSLSKGKEKRKERKGKEQYFYILIITNNILIITLFFIFSLLLFHYF